PGRLSPTWPIRPGSRPAISKHCAASPDGWRIVEQNSGPSIDKKCEGSAAEPQDGLPARADGLEGRPTEILKAGGGVMAALIVELNAAAETWVSVVWAVVWQSTLLIGAIALVAALALRRSSPALRFWVWQILALKLLLMPFWTCAVAVPRSVPITDGE